MAKGIRDYSAVGVIVTVIVSVTAGYAYVQGQKLGEKFPVVKGK